MKTIRLQCPKCKRTKQVKREPHDPANARTAILVCDRCDNGGFDQVDYLPAARHAKPNAGGTTP